MNQVKYLQFFSHHYFIIKFLLCIILEETLNIYVFALENFSEMYFFQVNFQKILSRLILLGGGARTTSQPMCIYFLNTALRRTTRREQCLTALTPISVRDFLQTVGFKTVTKTGVERHYYLMFRGRLLKGLISRRMLQFAMQRCGL